MKDISKVMHPVYLPFSEVQLKSHFADVRKNEKCLRSAYRYIGYYKKSLEKYAAYLSETQDIFGKPMAELRKPCQVEKDEKFWIIACMMALFHSSNRTRQLSNLLTRAYGNSPPLADAHSWGEYVRGDLRLYFEPSLPCPPSYKTWLNANLRKRHLIPHVLVSAEGKKILEGPTNVDAMLLNANTGFSVIMQAKVLSDISYHTTYDIIRNQIARNVDVMLESDESLCDPLDKRDPDKTLFLLITPKIFKDNPASRLYGFKMKVYKTHPTSLERDLPHRTGCDWKNLSRRLGWLTWEDFKEVNSYCCTWLKKQAEQTESIPYF